MVVGEGPAKDEVRHGYPFAGRSGTELDLQYLPAAGLCRPYIRVTNARKCPCPGFANPTHEQALDCARFHLTKELRETNPFVVLSLGAVAASIFDTSISLGRSVSLELDHGRPVRAGFGGWEGWLVPQYHPAAAMHQSALYGIPLQQDFTDLCRILRDLEAGREPEFPTDWFSDLWYRELGDVDELTCILGTYEQYQDGPAIDTESDGDTPWSVQFSLKPGTGYLIDARRHDLLSVFARWLSSTRPLVWFHHALSDLPVCHELGLSIPRYRDTLMESYWSQSPSLGLKVLAYRLCGMEMQDYTDLVVPYSRSAVAAWCSPILDRIRGEFQYEHRFRSGPRAGLTEWRFPDNADDGVRDTYNRLTALVRDLGKDPETDPWKRWEGWKDHVQQWCTALGPAMPTKSIVHVPRDQAIYYACRDADATLRLAPIARRAAAGVRKGIEV
jgi:uracil-DNA glycosylase family 4